MSSAQLPICHSLERRIAEISARAKESINKDMQSIASGVLRADPKFSSSSGGDYCNLSLRDALCS